MYGKFIISRYELSHINININKIDMRYDIDFLDQFLNTDYITQIETCCYNGNRMFKTFSSF